MICNNCGNNNEENAEVCAYCNAPINKNNIINSNVVEQKNEVDNNTTNNVKTEKTYDRPLSLWEFLGLFLLNLIPCVGLICAIIFACGAVKNQNVKNYARAQLILWGIVIIFYIIILMLGLAGVMMEGFTEGFASALN